MNEKFTQQELETFIQESLAIWHVPGLAVVVIQDGQVIHCQGYGKRDLEQDLPATADTLFPIASCTKAFTATCAALLVDEGKLEWDKPIRAHLPTFKLHDPFAAERMSMRDLLCHRSGLPRHDILWYASNFSRQEIFDRLQYVENNRDFRTTYQYQNMMFMVAGLLIHKLSGLTWEEFVQRRIFTPLGMSRSNMSTEKTQKDANHGTGYIYRKGKLEKLPFFEQTEKDSVGPAGTICSSVTEMANWLAMQINEGKHGATQLVTKNNLEETHKPNIFIDDPQARERFGFEFLSYGMGWSLRSYKGLRMVSHGGNIDGFSSLVSFLPQYKLGVVVLTNGDGYYNAIPNTLTYTIFDRLLGLEATDWNSKLKKINDEELEAVDRSQNQSASDRQAAPPSHPIEAYLGDYEHPGYGVYTLRKAGEGLEMVMNERMVMRVEPYHYDIFEAHFDPFDMHVKLSFNTDMKGNIAGFNVQIEPSVKEVAFTRLPDGKLNDPAYLQKFTGEYDFQGLTLSVSMIDGKLHAALPGQDHELIGYQGTEFKIKGEEGFGIAFKLDDTDTCAEAQIIQPGVVYVAKKKTH
jgi:CubicO group peptidase (beta-lactamase class C family)